MERFKRAYYAAVTERSESRHIVRFLRQSGLGPSSRILDVACGYGRNLEAMRAAGFSPVGVEISSVAAEAVRAKGFVCHDWGDPTVLDQEWDALVMAHIVEYFDWESLLAFIDTRVARLRAGGVLVIAAPLLDRAFYDDFDHVKPYNPHAIGQYFGRPGQQVKRHGASELELVDIWFHRRPYLLRYYRALLLPRLSPTKLLLAGLNVAFRLLHAGSAGIVGRKGDWVGLYRRVG